MVKAVLEYNPYKGETKVEFNGHSPRINSLVKKYEQKKLQDWIREVPQIFRDEMNGYAFELEFSGPQMDFEQLEKAFSDSGLTDEQVKISCKNEMDSREQTRNAIYDLLKWLGDSPGELFDLVTFKDTHEELFNEDYSIITINWGDYEPDFDDMSRITYENTVDGNDLKDVDLNNTPIVIKITTDMLPHLKPLIDSLKKKEDVYDNQVFFSISPALKEEKIQRVINDLGVKQLQLVDSPSDKIIKEYYFAYPVTDYIRHILDSLQERADEIENHVEKRVNEKEVTNKGINEQINELDKKTEKLRDSLSQLKNRDDQGLARSCADAEKRLIEKIRTWKKNKVYSTEEHAAENAEDYSRELSKYINEYSEKVNTIVNQKKDIIADDYLSIYAKSGNYEIENKGTIIQKSRYEMPDLKNRFLGTKKQRYETPKADLKELIFGDKNKVIKEKIITEYYYSEWREDAVDILSAIAKGIRDDQDRLMKEQLDMIADAYIEALDNSIKKNEDERTVLALRLSNDERRLQDERKWIADFKDRIKRIERG